MKIEMTAEALAQALRGNVVERKSTIPVLEYALVRDNQIITTDLDSYCFAPLEGKTEGNPNFLIPCRRMEKFLDGLTGPMTMKYEDRSDGPKEFGSPRVVVMHNGGKFAFNSMNKANFPALPEAPLLTAEFDGAEFKKTVDRVLMSISTEESRYTLNGALLMGDGAKVTMVSTDGYRLSIVDMESDAKIAKNTIIPRDALRWLSDNIDGNVSFGSGTDYLAFKTGGKILVHRAMKGQFPNWTAVLPKPENIKLTATFPSAKRLREALSKVFLFSDERSGLVAFRFGEESSMEAKCSETGKASFPIECVSTGELTIGWNGEYILDILNIVDDGEVTIELQDAQSGTMFHVGGMRYLAMPMRYSE